MKRRGRRREEVALEGKGGEMMRSRGEEKGASAHGSWTKFGTLG